MPTVLIPNAELEPIAQALDNWLKWLKPGSVSVKIGTLRGCVVPMAQGVFYDREAVIDAHAVWETFGEGEGERKARKVDQTKNDKGTVVMEQVVFKDPREFAKEMREFLKTEQPVVVPYLIEESWIKEQASQLVKEQNQAGLPPVDFGPLRLLRSEFAKLREG